MLSRAPAAMQYAVHESAPGRLRAHLTGLARSLDRDCWPPAKALARRQPLWQFAVTRISALGSMYLMHRPSLTQVTMITNIVVIPALLRQDPC